MFSFFKKAGPPFSVKEIKQDKHLTYAKEVSLELFFKQWMLKRPRKGPVGCCFILHEDEQFVYWGQPVFKGIFSDDRIVDSFYKTSKKALEERFPNYPKIWGNVVRLALQSAIHDYYQEQNTSYYVSVSLGFDAQLKEDYIEVKTPCSLQETGLSDSAKETTHFRVLFDKHDLMVKEIHPIDKT